METFAKRLFSGLIPDAQIGGLTFNTVDIGFPGFARRNLQKNKSSKIYDQAILSYNLSNYTDMSDSIGSVQQ